MHENKYFRIATLFFYHNFSLLINVVTQSKCAWQDTEGPADTNITEEDGVCTLRYIADILLPGSGPSMSQMDSAYKTLAFHLFKTTVNFSVSFIHSTNISCIPNLYWTVQ